VRCARNGCVGETMTALLGHDDRAVQHAQHDGRHVVTKTYTSVDSAEIFRSMRLLWASPFGRRFRHMPEPISHDGSTITMSFVPGHPMGSRGDLGGTPLRLENIADLLVRLHGSGVVVQRQRSASKLIRSLQRKQLDLPEVLVPLYSSVVARAVEQQPFRETLVVSHGDFSPRNLLVDGGRIAVIDFDRLQMAGPGRDVGYLAAWCWVTQLQIRGTGSWAIGDKFTSTYVERGGADILDADLRFHRACGLLRIAQSWSAFADRPDLARRVIVEASCQLGARR
jgi:hypothetical protein